MEKEGTEYTFFHHGNTLSLTLYDRFLRIENMDGKETWYSSSEDNLKELKEMFENDWASRKDSEKKKDNKQDTDKFHYDQMETESE